MRTSAPGPKWRRAAGTAAAALLAAAGLAACSSGGGQGGGPGNAGGSDRGAAPSASATASFGRRPAVDGVPQPRHVVVVVEENRAYQQIIGDPQAPYLNSLSAQGARFTAFEAETHPSQPNYLALFSGSTQGVSDDDCPDHAFSAPNLGSELIAAGEGFTGYSESLPAVGSTACDTGEYARRHVPWADFSNLPASANQPFTAFPRTPAGWAALPAVSFVIPNVEHDMHDGSIAQGDSWLRDNLGGYRDWARSHDSLLVVTWDEDDEGHGNRIPTLIDGGGVRPGTYGERLNHYNLLRTLEDAYGLSPTGAAATAAPIRSIWKSG
jgi:acid phosphatase